MLPSPTDYPSVITVENADGLIASVIYPRQFFLPRVAFCKTVGGCFFFPTESVIGNYRQLVSRRTSSVGETVGKNFTDGWHALQQRN